MGQIAESVYYTPSIYLIELTDAVVGGENGISNLAATGLANRTAWLKQFADEVAAARGGFSSLNARVSALEDQFYDTIDGGSADDASLSSGEDIDGGDATNNFWA